MTINFSLLATDQIINHAAAIHYMFGGQVKVPLVVRMPQGAGHQLGPTHSHSWEALFLHVPGLLVAVPSTAADAKGMLKAAIRDDNPVIFIEHEYLYGQRGDVPDDDDHIQQFGKAAIRREGIPDAHANDLTAGEMMAALRMAREVETARRDIPGERVATPDIAVPVETPAAAVARVEPDENVTPLSSARHPK